MPGLETIIRRMYMKENHVHESHMQGKEIIALGKKGTVGTQSGADGSSSDDEIYTVRFEDGTVQNIPVRDMQMIGESVIQPRKPAGPDHTYHVSNIDYDTDGDEKVKKSLPKNMKVNVPHHVHKDGEDSVTDHINDHISDKTGWLHRGYDHERITKKEPVKRTCKGSKVSSSSPNRTRYISSRHTPQA